jgi:hypothetical protein
VCVLAPDQRTLLEKRRTFCTPCFAEITNCNARSIAQEELMGRLNGRFPVDTVIPMLSPEQEQLWP